MLKEKLKRRVAVPSLFAIIQSRGGECHRRILKLQKQEAARTLSEAGSMQERRKSRTVYRKAKDKGILLQELAQALRLFYWIAFQSGQTLREIDEETIPLQMCLPKVNWGCSKKPLFTPSRERQLVHW